MSPGAIGDFPPATKAVGVETTGMTMRFGSFTALDNVSIKVTPGSFHALLGENGAGKSTLVKCIMGFYHPTAGAIQVDGREVSIASPKDAAALSLGMVYQHFTLVPSLTGAENLVISRQVVPGIIDWSKVLPAVKKSSVKTAYLEIEEPYDPSAIGMVTASAAYLKGKI